VKKVLVITYYWPPGGGAGVQRWLKMARYLPEFDIEPLILTVDSDYATYPATDISLEKDIPAGLNVFKTKATDYFRLLSRDKTTLPSAGFAKEGKNSFREKFARFIRGNLFIPDPRRGWNRFAYKNAVEIIDNYGIKTIVTTSPPHSTQLIGLRLKKRFPDIKWIADLRDPWTDIYYYREFYPSLPVRILDKHLEKKVITCADHLITVGPSLTELFITKHPAVSGKTTVIRNGYDPADFKELRPHKPALFTISYIGTLSDSYNLTGLIGALRELENNGKDYRLRFTGYVSEQQRRLLIENLSSAKVEFHDYCSHPDAIEEMLNASVLLLLIPEHKSSKVILTGKLYEYIATGKPVICVGPVDGDAASIVASLGNGITANYNDHAVIKKFLEEAMAGKVPDREFLPVRFSRKNGAEKLSGLI
jgi:glycosyltransferase involved in cell wall biosynthesis